MTDIDPDRLDRVECRDVLDGLRSLPDESIQCVVTSPPYFGLRDYGANGQIGVESTPDEYIDRIVEVFREARRVLRTNGTLWLNLGDSYANDGKWGGSTGGKHVDKLHGGSGIGRQKKTTGLKPKDLIGVPWRIALALQSDGWWLRQDIIWHKPNPMPESVTDRCTRAHEYLFMLTRSAHYYYDAEAIKTPGTAPEKEPDGWDTGAGAHGTIHRKGRSKGRNTDRQRGHSVRHAGFNDRWDALPTSVQCSYPSNKRSVWTIAPAQMAEAHFATFPEALVEPCVLAGSREGDVVLDPFAGSATAGVVAIRLGRRFIGFELNPEYAETIAGPRLEAARKGISVKDVRSGQGALFE